MAWSTPLTAVSNAALTAAQWNASVRDNLAETAPAKATTSGSIFVGTGANSIAERIPTSDLVGNGFTESTTSTAYTALTTSGPAVTVTTGAKALVIISSTVLNSTAGASSYMSWQISGATTVAAADGWALEHRDSGTNGILSASRVTFQSSLNPGSHTVTAQYRVSAGTGTWQRRHMVVIPL